MIFDTYAEKQLLCNLSFSGSCSNQLFAYRGDLVIIEGEIADTQGRRHPPKAVVKQAVCLADDKQVRLIAGAIDEYDDILPCIERYAADLSSEAKLWFYIGNLSKALQVEVKGFICTLLPHDESSVWTMLMDDLRLEKEDFKGQSAEDKVLTMFKGICDYRAKGENLSFEAGREFLVEQKREARGAV